tara:strand:+ start:61 stop:534 length:474 start_codon:yes stop_codon:yes gene_type:complete
MGRMEWAQDQDKEANAALACASLPMQIQIAKQRTLTVEETVPKDLKVLMAAPVFRGMRPMEQVFICPELVKMETPDRLTEPVAVAVAVVVPKVASLRHYNRPFQPLVRVLIMLIRHTIPQVLVAVAVAEEKADRMEQVVSVVKVEEVFSAYSLTTTA